MTISAVAISTNTSATFAGKEICEELMKTFEQKCPHVLLVFASSQYDFQTLLQSLDDNIHPDILIGCSSAGEFTDQIREEGAVCAVGIWSDKLKFSASVGLGLRGQMSHAAEQIASQFIGLNRHDYRYHTAMVLTDALAGYTDDFIQALTVKTQGKYQLVGGGAGDDAKFTETHVFLGREVYKDAAVALEILSNQPVGIGFKHGWEPASLAMRVTEAEGSCLISINGAPTIEALRDFAEQSGQTFDTTDPLPFFLHNVIGIKTSNGHKLRVPLAVNEDGSIACASTIPVGSTIHIMRTSHASAAEAAAHAAEMALSQLNGNQPKVAIFFDCVATRLRMGLDFDMELKTLSKSLNGAEFVGCNTYGQIARVDGQFSGFHNCTAVACLLP